MNNEYLNYMKQFKRTILIVKLEIKRHIAAGASVRITLYGK